MKKFGRLFVIILLSLLGGISVPAQEESPTAVLTPVPGKVYTIRSTSLKRMGANEKYLRGYLDGATGYEECENVSDRPDFLWYFEPSSPARKFL